jgi:cytochrome c oxidase subunit 1
MGDSVFDFFRIYYWFDTLLEYIILVYSDSFLDLFFAGVNLLSLCIGVAGMPRRRIPDYPDAFYAFCKIASWGSYISAVSVLFFYYGRSVLL